jgi:hypothetical protein
MRVITRPQPLPEIIATCRCGCKFAFDEHEGRWVSDPRDGDYIKVACPHCGKTVSVARSVASAQQLVRSLTGAEP